MDPFEHFLHMMNRDQVMIDHKSTKRIATKMRENGLDPGNVDSPAAEKTEVAFETGNTNPIRFIMAAKMYQTLEVAKKVGGSIMDTDPNLDVYTPEWCADRVCSFPEITREFFTFFINTYVQGIDDWARMAGSKSGYFLADKLTKFGLGDSIGEYLKEDVYFLNEEADRIQEKWIAKKESDGKKDRGSCPGCGDDDTE